MTITITARIAAAAISLVLLATSNATNKNDTWYAGNGKISVLPASSTALALTGGTSPAAPGVPLTFTATVTGSSPTGSVSTPVNVGLVANPQSAITLEGTALVTTPAITDDSVSSDPPAFIRVRVTNP